MAVELSTSTTTTQLPANQDQLAEDLQSDRVTTGAVDTPANEVQPEDQDVTTLNNNLQEAVDNVGTASDDLVSFLTSFGLITPEDNPDASSFDKIRQLLKNLQEALNTMRSAYAESAAQAAIAGFDISLAGVDEMLDQAKAAFQMAIASGVLNMVAQLGTATFSLYAIHDADKEKIKFRGNQENYVFMQVRTQVAGAIGGSVSGASKVTDGAGQQATTEGQAASKEADAQAQLLQTLRDSMEEMLKLLNELLDKFDQARAGTNQADRAFRTKA